jgi:hypothetical protein
LPQKIKNQSTKKKSPELLLLRVFCFQLTFFSKIRGIKVPIQNWRVHFPKRFVAPVLEFFQFGGCQIVEPLFQFPFKQVATEADFLQNGLHIV